MIIEDVITQHAEEASFLWLLRDLAVRAPHYSLPELAELDTRLEAHIDGLRIAGNAGWKICKEALSQEEAGELFVVGFLAFRSGDEAHLQAVLDAGRATPELSRGLASALGWLPYPQAERHIQQLFITESPSLCRIGIAACAVYRQDPGKELSVALSSNDVFLQARALRAVGQLGRIDLLPNLQTQLTADNDLCRYSAAWSAALLGDLGAISPLQALARSDVPYQEDAAKIALRRMELAAAHEWRLALTQDPVAMRLAVIGAGVIGDPVSIPWLIDQMTIPELSRVAGEAFTMITGMDLTDEDLEGEWPEGLEAGPTENPEDENVNLDPDEDLLWPEPELIDKWWHTHRREFQVGTRYLIGKPMSSEWLQDVLRNGMQRQRASAALELVMRQPGQPLFEVRAPGFRQQQLLREHPGQYRI